MHVEQLAFAVVKPQLREKYINRPSATKGCKTKQAEVQIPSSISKNS